MSGLFTLGQVAAQGLPAGKYIVRVDDVEGGQGQSGNPIVKWTCIVAQQPDNPQVKIGAKAVWSTTVQPEYIGILANDLLRVGYPRVAQFPYNAVELGKTLAQNMRGKHYVIQITPQKNDSTRTNTSFLAPFDGAAAPAAAPAPAPAAVAPAPTLPTMQQQPASVAPAMAPQPVAAQPLPIAAPGGAQTPPPIGPTAATGAPGDEMPGLTPAIIAALQAGVQVQLNARQIRELQEMGLQRVDVPAVSAGAVTQQQQPAPAGGTAFGSV